MEQKDGLDFLDENWEKSIKKKIIDMFTSQSFGD